MSMGDWICGNTTIRRRPFSFSHYEFQKEITDDMHPDLAVEKCSQIGLTEIQIRKFLATLARNPGTNGIFTFPDLDMQTRQYNSRIRPVLESDRIFSPNVGTKPVRNKDQVQIRDSFGYISGCTEGAATSTSADFLMHDELDLSPQPIIALYQSRLQNSTLRMTQKFSTPTFLDYGINKAYQMTDQREYLIKCQACNHHQAPAFSPEFIHVPDFHLDIEKFMDLTPEQVLGLNLDECYVRCEKCHKPLDLADPAFREWVAKYPTRTSFRGYKVRPFSTGRLSPAYIFRQLAKYISEDAPRGFYNTVLGEPFTESSAQLQKVDIEACLKEARPPTVSQDTPVYLGVDMGQTCHLTLSIDDEVGHPVFVLFEAIPVMHLQDRIQDLRKVYNIIQGCADRFPYTPTVDALRDATSQIVIPVQYGGKAQISPNKDETGTITHYSANRTQALDRIATPIRQRTMVLSGYTTYRETLLTHLRDMVRDERAEHEPEWKKLNNNDHFFHSMGLNVLSRRISDHMYNADISSSLSSVIITEANWMRGTTPMTGYYSGLQRISRLG